MKLSQRLMKLFAPVCEKERLTFREELSRTQAMAEDMTRSLRFGAANVTVKSPGKRSA